MKCLGCGYPLEGGGKEVRCPYCGSILSDIDSAPGKGVRERLDLATEFRRVGRFDDSQQELESLLEANPELPEAYFGCFLNYYEVTEYAFNADSTVRYCKTYTSDRRPVEKNRDLQDATQRKKSLGVRGQWIALSESIERLRKENLGIKQSLPKYRAALICDYANKTDFAAAQGIYKILSEKTDIFFPAVSLRKIPESERVKYLVQTLKNPEIVPLMFVIYSDSFNYRNKAADYNGNVAGQCRDFARVHTKAELFSVTCDYEPSPMMKQLSIKTVRCADFDRESYRNIADKILENILVCAYTDDEYFRFDEGEAIALNDGGLSPPVTPL